jgi:copper resistance protein B
MAWALLPACAGISAARAETPIWGIEVEQAEYRYADDAETLAWDFDAVVGSDEVKAVWRGEGEYETRDDTLETFENQLRLQIPISDFFDAVGGVRVDAAEGPNRAYGVIGIHGLLKQWIEVDADLFVSDRPIARFEAEYEGLITNRLILTPSLEIDIPLADDEAIGQGAWAPTIELGARLGYDLIDRLFSPYIGVHYERSFGETADLARDEGEDDSEVFFVVGARVLF